MPGCERGPQVTELVAGGAWPRRAKVAQRSGNLTPDRLGGLDEFPSGFDPRWGGRKRDGSQRKQLTQVWGVRLPGGCLTSTSGGPRCPGAAGNPRWDLTSLHGRGFCWRRIHTATGSITSEFPV
ncbi:hypothetical protein AV530_000115 [Patagioenas fasciata monilis]|uniref:Uncharacterized protein n=1 Tax=Patagioenas fasciata monilis TaxID=372326 RepID=A0A1V4K0C7_PATFA|nr:hypothetical protein AV530_000115 [Patagioenas fasciata monilis]